MKKTLCFLAFFVAIFMGYAQVPSYYNDVNLNQTGQNLKDALSVKIIGTHSTTLSYTPGVWDALKQSDLDPTDPTKVLLIYGYNDSDGVFKTDRTRGKDDNGGNVGDWNREHTYPKSLGNPNLGTTGPGSDAHHLRACDGQMNSTRNNRKYADGSGNAGITASSDFYPGDEWKGDVARMMMYMYLRYGNQCLPTNVGVGNAVAGDANMIDLFLQWNVEDPVNAFEDNRNNVLAGIQGNRNPFIDNPAFATQIWGGPQAEDRFGGGSTDTEAPTVPTNLVASGTTSSATVLSWTAATDNVGVTGYDVFQDNALIASIGAVTTYNVSGLAANTTYSFTVKAKDQAGNSSANSTAVSVTTLAVGSGGDATDLFFSEYVEGSSYNKALEVANFTGSAVDLSIYTIKKQTNGSGSWSTGYNLSGTVVQGDVFVLAHSSASSNLLNEADATSSGSEIIFNGNDAVGLFKNDVLIDIIGTFNGGSANFAQDVTLRRKSNILSPNTTYTTSEWDSYASNTFDNVGSHTVDGGSGADTTAPTVPASLVASNITETTVDLSWGASTDNVAVTGYKIFQDGNLVDTITSTNYTVNGLTVVTSYAFTVSAIDAAGNESNQSNETNITTIDSTAPTAPASLVASNITETTVHLSWNASTDNVAVEGYDVYQDNTLIASLGVVLSYQVGGLNENTSYNFNIKAKDQAGNESVNSNSVNITTLLSSTGGATELFLSEYVEGSSFNKALEIANFTGGVVDLSQYSLKKQTNGSGSWSSAYILSGNLLDGEVFVLAHSSASNSLKNRADVTTTHTVINFNGNDPVGLFKNNVLIDIIGTFNGGKSNFAKDVTKRRKPTILSPNTTYTVSEWDSYSRNTFSDVGTHTIGSGASRASQVAVQDDFSVKLSTTGNAMTVKMNDTRIVSYQLYTINGQVIAKGKFSKQTNIDNVRAGLYILKINDGQRAIQKKILKK